MVKRTILAIILLSIATASTSITGHVFDENGKSLSFAVITGGSTQNWDIADENGRFILSFLTKKGDTLRVNRYGYESTQFIIDNNTFYNVLLKSRPIVVNSLTVVGKHNAFNETFANSYFNNLTKSNSKIILNQVPGIIVRTYGGNAGNISIGTIGSSATHTKLLLGGIDLTSIQNGESDASQIPPAMLNQITVANSPGIFYGSGAADAAINIEPIITRSYLSLMYGNYNKRTIDGNYHKNFGKISLNLLGGYFTDDGNFSYTNDSVDYIRENNDFKRFYYAINGKVQINQRSNLHIFLMNSDQRRGSAGSTIWPTLLARREDKLIVRSIVYNLLNKNGYSSFLLNTRKSIEKYNNPESFLLTKSEHTINSNSFRFNQYNNILDYLSTKLMYELKEEKIESTDVGKRNRLTNSIAGELDISIIDDINFLPSIRFDKVKKLDLHTSSSFRILYNGIENLNIEYAIGNGFRNPSFNDMYWVPGGNPELHPEVSNYQSFKIKFSNFISSGNYIYLNIIGKNTDDLIQWVPIDDTFLNWEPHNVVSTSITNLILGGRLRLDLIPVTISGHLTLSKSNDDELKTELLYSPKIVGYLGLYYENPKFVVGLHTHYTDERISAYGNPEDEILPGYWFYSFIAKYNLKLIEHAFTISVEIDNLLDESYISVSGYPEPGRTFSFGINYTL